MYSCIAAFRAAVVTDTIVDAATVVPVGGERRYLKGIFQADVAVIDAGDANTLAAITACKTGKSRAIIPENTLILVAKRWSVWRKLYRKQPYAGHRCNWLDCWQERS